MGCRIMKTPGYTLNRNLFHLLRFIYKKFHPASFFPGSGMIYCGLVLACPILILSLDYARNVPLLIFWQNKNNKNTSMRKIVKSSFLICSFTNTPQSYVLFLQSAKFFAENNTKIHQPHIPAVRHCFRHTYFHTLYG